MNNAQCWFQSAEVFRPDAPPTIHDSLPPGLYKGYSTPFGFIFDKRTVPTDGLLTLADSPTTPVIANIRKFWQSAEVFGALGMTHKRGVLFHGPPGTGKSAMLALLAQELIADGGLV